DEHADDEQDHHDDAAILQEVFLGGVFFDFSEEVVSAYGANIGWIHFGQGPTNGCAYSNGSKDDFGVNHDGSGGLSGFAWGANVGWLAFETNGNPRIDLSNGKMSGSIYGANIGWISLSNLHAHVQTDSIQPSPDNDGDTIPDAWEIKAVGNTNELFLGGDFDGDGVPDESEYLADSHPGDSNSFLWITLARHQSATSTLTWASRPTRQYLIETADRLTNPPAWVDTGLGLQIPTSSSTTTRAFADIVNDLKFFRVRSVLPLAP
ncbi:MAG: hypothetical protein AAF492_05830, partial [Verrucomicrobiota bacterium]